MRAVGGAARAWEARVGGAPSGTRPNAHLEVDHLEPKRVHALRDHRERREEEAQHEPLVARAARAGEEAVHPHEAGGVARVLLVVPPLGDVLAHLYTGNVGNVGCEIWGHVTPLGDVLAHLVGGEVAPLDHRLAQLLARHRRRRQRDGERAPGEQRVGRRALRQRQPVDRAERQQVELLLTQRFLLESQKPPAERRSARMSWRGGGGNLSTYNPTTRLAFAVRPQSFSIFCSLMWRASRSTSFASMSSAPASSESSFRSAPTSSRMKRSLWRGRGAGCE